MTGSGQRPATPDPKAPLGSRFTDGTGQEWIKACDEWIEWHGPTPDDPQYLREAGHTGPCRVHTGWADDPRVPITVEWLYSDGTVDYTDPQIKAEAAADMLTDQDAADRAAGFLRVRPADPDLIERIARALYLQQYYGGFQLIATRPYEPLIDEMGAFRDQARAVLSALQEETT